MEYHEISQPSSNGPGVGLIKGVALLENGHIPNHSSQSKYTSSAGHASDRILSPETDSNICIDQLLSDVLNSSRTIPAKPNKTSRTYSWMTRDPEGSTDSPDLVPRRESKKLLEKKPRKNGLRSPHPMQSSMQTKNSKLKVDILQKSQKNSYDISCDHDGQYSSSCQHLDASEHINIYEYEKARPSQEDRYSEYYGYHRYLHPYQKRSSKGGKLDEVDDDQFNVFICMLFCIMGLGVIIGLVILLCQYVDQKEQDQEKAGLGPVDEDCVQLLNNVYFRRVAHLIERVDKHSLALSSEAKEKLWLCPLESPLLVGNTTDVNLNISVNIDVINELHSDVRMGGEWRPPSCISRHRVAIIIPYRDRWNHLKVLLHYLIPTLKRQQIHFRIFVVEQYGNETFNKGRIMNAAFREALQLFDFQCVTFHDVDLVPEDDRNMYSCTEQPKHMSISIDKFQYTLPYQGLVGGVLMFRTDHFQLVNGYSNMYWGWGAEDDDMTTRILHRGLRIYRPPSNIARYKMVKHEGRKGSEVAVRMKLLRSAARRSKLEGLNNVQYKLVSTQIRELFTHFIVDIGTP